jgi:formylglycine-generating enzyme required for sulfatase activity
MQDIREGKDVMVGDEPVVVKEVPPIPMVYVKGGCFEMGDFSGIGDDDELPLHEVCIDDYYIAETEVSQELFESVMTFNPSFEKDPQKPVTNVNWFGVMTFIEKLNERKEAYYRLPTEAEWEYAARGGGENVVWSGTDNEGELGDYAWYVDSSDEQTHKVGTRRPNQLGVYDMSGNVWEWVEDYLDFEYYELSPIDNPYGPDMSLWKVIRGGSFVDDPVKMRTTFRYGYVPSLLAPHLGFRIAE